MIDPSISDPFRMTREALTNYVFDIYRDNTNQEITPADARLASMAIIRSMLTLKSDTLSVNQVKGGTHLKLNLAGMLAIEQKYRVIGMSCVVANPASTAETNAGIVKEPATFMLVANPSGNVIAYVDADSTRARPASWVQTSGSEDDKIQTYPVFNAETQYTAGDPVQYMFVNGAVRLFQARRDLSSPSNPAPTGLDGDPNWIAFSTLTTTHDQNTDLGTSAQMFTLLRNSQNQEQGEQRTILGFGKAQGARPAALAYRWQNEDNTPATVLEICHSYRDPLAPQAFSDAVPPPNVWEPLGAYWLKQAASADDATTISEYVAQLLLSYVTTNDPRLPVLLPGNRTLWVRGGGQAANLQAGTFQRPYATIQAAHNVAQAGDVIHVLPGGTGVDAKGRQYYTEDFGLTTNVTVVCAPGVIIGGLVQIGAFAGSFPYQITWVGGEITGRFIVWRQFVPSSFEIEGAKVSGIGNLEYGVGGTYDNHVSKMRIHNCQVDSTRANTVIPAVALIGRDDMGPMELIIDNTIISSANSACIGWRGVAGSTIVLRGSTELRNAVGQPKTRTDATIPYNIQYAESDWLIDQRPAAVALPAGTAVALTQNTSYHFTSGTFTIQTSDRIAGAVSSILVGVGVSLPAALSTAPFILPPSTGTDDPTKERVVMLQVLRDRRILTTITPLS